MSNLNLTPLYLDYLETRRRALIMELRALDKLLNRETCIIEDSQRQAFRAFIAKQILDNNKE